MLLEQMEHDDLYGNRGEYIIKITVESKDQQVKIVKDASFEISGDEAVWDLYSDIKNMIEDRGGFATGLEQAEGMEESEYEY